MGASSRLVVLVSCSILVLAGAAAAPVGATPPSNDVLIVLTQRAADFAPIEWHAGGLVSDSGTWERGLVRFQGGRSSVFAGTIQTTETGALGSFQMNFQGLGNALTFSGTWQISRGT